MNDPGLDDQIQENARDVARKYHENHTQGRRQQQHQQQHQQHQQCHRNSGHRHDKADRSSSRDEEADLAEQFEEGMLEDGNVVKGFTEPGFV